METELRTHLLELANLYAKARGMELSTVAQRALGDWRFFQRLEDKATASFTVRKYDAAVAWFDGQWPEDAAWPEGVSRPSASEDRAA